MNDKIEFKVELKFFLDCPDSEISRLKEKLEDLGWWVLQEVKLDKATKGIPEVVETGYDVVVTRLGL